MKRDADEKGAQGNEKEALRADTFLCQKSGKRLPIKGAKCPLPNDYCKFRTACMINNINKLN